MIAVGDNLMQESIRYQKKKKIMTRLSIAVYKMTDEQLLSLMSLFKGLDLNAMGPILEDLKVPSGNGSSIGDRELILARFFTLIHQLSESDLFRFLERFEKKKFAMLRQFPRVPCQITLDMAANERAVNCFAKDISAGGMFVESFEPFEVGQRLIICFSIEKEQLALKLKGIVIRQEYGGVGVQFESPTFYQLEIMKGLIRSCHQMFSSKL